VLGKQVLSLRQKLALKHFELYARLRGYTFQIAKDATELEAVYQIRWKVYSEAGYIPPETFRDRRMVDKYDEWSVNFIGFYHEKPVGTIRLTPLSKGSPILNAFVVEKWPDARSTMEIGRFAVLPEVRHTRIVAVGLVGQMSMYSLNQKIGWWVGYAPRPLLKVFRWLFRYEVIPTLPVGEREQAIRAKTGPGYFGRYGKWIVVFRSRPEWITPWKWMPSLR